MPLYIYKCGACSHEFEDLVSYDRRNESRQCPSCGGESGRVEVTPFGVSTKIPVGETIVSRKEIDLAVGADAEKRRALIENRRKRRWSGMEPHPIDVPRADDGSYKPVEVLGKKNDRMLRREYSRALAEHRAERMKRGEGQFDGPGAIS